MQVALDRFLARRALGRRLVRRRLEAIVAEAALAALRHDHLLAVLDDVRDDLARRRVTDDRSQRDTHEEILAIAPVALLLRAVLARRREAMGPMLVFDQRVEMQVAHEDHVPAAATVAAVGPALHDRLLAAEGGDAIAALSAANMDECFINKHGSKA